MITKLAILILVVMLGASIIGNVLLYQQNGHLMSLLDRTARENMILDDALSESGPNAGSIDPTNIQKEPQPDAKPQNDQRPDDNPPDPRPADSGQSIAAAAVRPLIIRDGFFERTQYEGTIMDILVSIRENGDGLVLVNTEIPTGVDFQESAKAAVNVAQDYMDADLSDKDIVFSISIDADKSALQTVDGYSAGAAMTVLLVSELWGMPIRNDVVITGSIMPDGNIGTVGGIHEKAKAAGMHGAAMFLVPPNQNWTQVESCEESRTGNFIYKTCTLEKKPLSPMTEERFGMRTIEVADIDDAMRYFHTG